MMDEALCGSGQFSKLLLLNTCIKSPCASHRFFLNFQFLSILIEQQQLFINDGIYPNYNRDYKNVLDTDRQRKM